MRKTHITGVPDFTRRQLNFTLRSLFHSNGINPWVGVIAPQTPFFIKRDRKFLTFPLVEGLYCRKKGGIHRENQ